MRNIVLSVCVTFLFLITTALVSSKKPIEVKKIDTESLVSILNRDADTLFVVNFWATWCRPCVAELPYFDEAKQKYEGKIAIKLISMDFENQMEKKVIPFLKSRDYDMEYYLMTATNYDAWMPKVNNQWSGSIPATVFYNKTKEIRHFHEGEYKKEELFSTIDSLLSLP